VSGVVSKGVIPAAGLGTRFLPATKAQPKELLTLVDRPVIQHVVEEAVTAGVSDFLIVTARGKPGLEDHFDRSYELEARLEAAGKTDELALVRAVAELASFHYTRQGEPLGLGHAVGLARFHVGDQPFAVLLPDDIVEAGVLEAMIALQSQYGGSVIALQEVDPEAISSYGCARVEEVEPGLLRLCEIVEKPPTSAAPSNLAVVGRYVLSPTVFTCLERVSPGRGGEIQLTDALSLLMDEEPVYGFRFEERFDTGNKLGFLRATVELGLRHPELGKDFREMLAEVVRQHGIP
jgi:UTP--glucose-1-phosphate uridylyltransferase